MRKGGIVSGPNGSPVDCAADVVVRLHGGPGNQLFQYAAAAQFGREANARVWVVDPDRSRFVSDLLGLTFAKASPPLAVRSGAQHNRSMQQRIWRRVRSIVQPDGQTVIRQGPADCFKPRLGEPVQNRARVVGLDGYFQHPSWHRDVADDLAARIRVFLEGITKLAQPAEYVVVSLRRGDYVQLGWALTEAYYRRAISQADVSGRQVFVVADDPLLVSAAAEWLRRPVDQVRPPSVPLEKMHLDFALLCGARQVIMSNSTFAWWGVAAGDTAGVERQIFAPARWVAAFSDSSVMLRDAWTPVKDI